MGAPRARAVCLSAHTGRPGVACSQTVKRSAMRLPREVVECAYTDSSVGLRLRICEDSASAFTWVGVTRWPTHSRHRLKVVAPVNAICSSCLLHPRLETIIERTREWECRCLTCNQKPTGSYSLFYCKNRTKRLKSWENVWYVWYWKSLFTRNW